MSTLAAMKARIANELARDDLTAEIAEAIATAIDAYHDQPFWWTWARDKTFNTVAAQQAYTASDDADIGAALAIDHAFITVSSVVTGLTQITQQEIEEAATPVLSGQPSSFSWFNDTLYLYPVPVDAYAVRLVGRFLVDPPASDGEADNRWMIAAERLVRSRAKWELAIHVLADDGLAARMEVAAVEAKGQLERITEKRRRIGRSMQIRPVSF